MKQKYGDDRMIDSHPGKDRGNALIGKMLEATRSLRRGSIEDIEYYIILLRFTLFEEKVISPEDFAELENQPVITLEYLKSIEKGHFDWLAKNDLESIKSEKLMAESSDIVWERMLKNNKKGNGKITEEEIKGLEPFLFAHKVQEAEKRLTELKGDISAKKFFAALLITFMEENGIPYDRLETTKKEIIMLGIW